MVPIEMLDVNIDLRVSEDETNYYSDRQQQQQ